MSVPTGKRRGRQPRTPADPVLADVVRRVVEVAHPQQIILFGSAARGTMRPNSDLDLLVIKGGRFNRRRVIDAIHRGLRGAEAAVDVVLVTPEEVLRYRNSWCLVIAPALEEGKVIYAAKTPATR
jgi:predicted nucleotidyltransferase